MEATFPTSVVQVLVEERREARRQQWNKDKIQPNFEIGDVIKAHVEVQSNTYQGEVKNLISSTRTIPNCENTWEQFL